jgi:hypothetical protein
MNAKSILYIVTILSLRGTALKAQDPPPALFAAVTPTMIPAVTFTGYFHREG